MARLAGRLASLLLDQFYPPFCLSCEAPVAGGDGVCARCFTGLRAITAPLCPRLGLPFEIALGPDALSAEAIADPPPFDRARSAVLYGAVAQTLVARLKYGDRPELASFCGRMMAGAGREFWAARPVLVPVPLHPKRQFSRRYNQSGELARAIAAQTGLKVDPLALQRTRLTRQQVGLSAVGRARNVAGAFTAHPDLLARLGGRGVVLIDDVYTTGATVGAATRALRRAGAASVDVLTFARVPSGTAFDGSDLPAAPTLPI
ncbi:ComF family protein [Arsenicitalea aurantiaca]|uniref:ComF family protein n=1 Tax=Arsenicitalea aurantiaca TaxID=1783274 RepID=A0A433X5Y3_9HYPH|nr:ComF family protein [Arsenicitalea aurantiaca]RUT29458.1 ComF family protein [Arsenicitalea aurantiaca]